MPNHLDEAFKHRMNKLFTERNLTPTECNLLKIYKDLIKKVAVNYLLNQYYSVQFNILLTISTLL
jgi:hypothetical protein